MNGVLLAHDHIAKIDETPLRETVLDALRDRGMIQVLPAGLSRSSPQEPRSEPGCRGSGPGSSRPWRRPGKQRLQQVCLEFNVDSDALVDVLDDGGSHARIVLSDTVPGGGGLVETLTRRLADDPRRFDALVAAAAEPSDSEISTTCP